MQRTSGLCTNRNCYLCRQLLKSQTACVTEPHFAMKLISVITALLMLASVPSGAIDVRNYRFHQMPETSYYGGINSIVKDSVGRIWFSGTDALFMFNGHSFENMGVTSPDGKPVDYRALVVDDKGVLHAATSRGLYSFDYLMQEFSLTVEGDVGAIAPEAGGRLWMILNDNVMQYENGERCCICPLPDTVRVSPLSLHLSCASGHVYVGAYNRLFRLVDGKYRDFAVLGDDENAVICDVVEDSSYVYVQTRQNGLYVYDKEGRPAGTFHIPEEYGRSSMAKKLYIDSDGIVWVATQSGLLLIDVRTGETRLLVSSLMDKCSLPNNSVWSIYPDPDGGVWIGTYGGKLAYQTFHDSNVRYMEPAPGGLNFPIVSTFSEDYDGNIWIGTEGGGVFRWNRTDDSFARWKYASGDRRSLNSNMIKRMRPIGGLMYVAAFNGGISTINLSSGEVSHLPVRNPVSGQPLSVYDFEPEGDSGFWLTDPDAELMFWNRSTGKVENVIFYDEKGRKIRLRVETLYHDDSGNLWLMTHDGVFVMDPAERKILRRLWLDGYSHAENNICCYCRTSSSAVWFGTRGGGVNVLFPDGTYRNYNTNPDKDFENRTVFGILEDSATGDIWISTDAGLFCRRSADGVIRRAGIDIPARCGAYYVRSCYSGHDGEMLFGGTNGFIMFNPGRFRPNPQKPKVYFTGLRVNDHLVSPGETGYPLKQAVATLDGKSGRGSVIRLSSRQSNFDIGFSCNSYLEQDRNVYAYRMLGMSDKWTVLPKNQQYVRFVDVPPGKYSFQMKAANNDGVWGDSISSLTFKVKPYPLLSPLAYVIYFMILVFSAYCIWVYVTRRKMLEQQLELEKEKEKNLQELTQARINFFTSISHDLKTPLTLVLDPLKQLDSLIPEDAPYRSYVELISRNVVRIQHMISQLLKFRQIETLKLPMDNKPGDIVKFVDNIFTLFESYAGKHRIETDFMAQPDSFFTEFDYDVIEKVFTNLFSNAIKYTAVNGYVSVRVSRALTEDIPATDAPEGAVWLSFVVTNSGEDIPEEKIDTIFEPFNRQGSMKTSFGTHTGLGLAIVKELVADMKGSISVRSEDSVVSFTVVLPFVPRAVDSIGSTSGEGQAYDYAESEIDNMISDMDSQEESTDKKKKKMYDILVVEDDAQLRNYLEQRLSAHYNVYTAINGLDGLAKVEKVMPQIVITDLAMPEADGFEVCRRIRSNIKTSHIPIIVISALGENQNAGIEALECEANVFIDKPVNIDFLQKQISNLIKNQNRLKDLYSKKFIAEPSRIAISSVDEELMKKAVGFIEKNLENEDYSVDDFVSDMAIGRTRLYQKLNDLTGMSIKEFILDIRLKRASQLLSESDYTVAEISAMTGFANPKYFSVCFKRHFGQSPTEFKMNPDAE